MNRYQYVRGFNYQPSYAWNSYEAWKFFDAAVFEREIALGKKFFPSMNTVRLWLSYDAFRYEEDRQVKNFETALQICAKCECKVIPVLFNCWHDTFMDNGGIFHAQMIPGSVSGMTETMYDSYIEKIVGQHTDDERILIWDICNEPFSFGGHEEYKKFMLPYEMEWLKKMYHKGKATGAKQPFGISHAPVDLSIIEATLAFSDVLLVHPYYFFSDQDLQEKDDAGFDLHLRSYVELAKKHNIPLLTTETCWGSKYDDVRAEMVKRTLSAHRRAEMGFVVHALHYSHVADLHNSEDGVVGHPGNLAFVNKDDTIRKGHEIFNLY